LFPHRFYRARLYAGDLPPPALAPGGSAGFQSNCFTFNLAAVAGQTVIIEASTNLVNWSALSTNTLESGLFLFSDPTSTNFLERFYRARLQ
jgi:hypothetical protein